MANSLNTTNGKAELKDYYDPYDSMYEALKRKRKRAADRIISDQTNDTGEFSKVPNPQG